MLFRSSRLFFNALLLFVSLAFLTACSKNDVKPPLPNEYVLDKIEFFMGDDDSINSVVIDLPAIDIENRGNVLLEGEYMDDFKEVVKTSVFVLDSAGKLPDDLDLAKFEVQVPGQYSTEGQLINADHVFSISDTEQQIPLNIYEPGMKKYRVAPKSRINITRQIKRSEISCSFTATIGNKTTETLYTVTGKWKGVLQYDGYSVLMVEHSLQ